MRANGKVVVVTGAGNGMGRQTAFELLKRGARVAAIDLRSEWLSETVELSSDKSKIIPFTLDISDLEQVSTLPAKVVSQFGAVDGLINVAGIIQKFVKIADLSYEDLHKVFNVNFFGTVQMVKEFLPYLLKRDEAQILNVSSMGGYVPVPGQTMYGASKAALRLFTEGLRSELKGTGVGVALVFPGAVNTNISINSGVMTSGELSKYERSSSHQVKSTDQVLAGKLIVDAFEANAFHAFIGRDAKTMDYLSRLVPKRAANLIQKQMASLIK